MKTGYIIKIACLCVTIFYLNSIHAKVHDGTGITQDWPESAVDFLSNLPSEKIQLEHIWHHALKNTHEVRALQAQMQQTSIPSIEARAPEYWNFKKQVGITHDNSQPTNAFMPKSSRTQYTELTARKLWSTGTTLETVLESRKSSMDFSGIPNPDFRELRGRISLTQDLWRNFGGYLQNLQKESADAHSNKLYWNIAQSYQELLISLSDIFHMAWLGQARLLSAQKAVDNSKKLLRITQKKSRRGTAEEVDLLQVQNSLIQAEINFSETKQNLKEIWRGLVISLEFPNAWIEIPLHEIPIALNSRNLEAQNFCKQERQMFLEKMPNWQVLQAQLQEAQLRKELHKEQMKPDIQAFANFSNHRLENKFSRTIKRFGEFRYPGFTLGLQFKWDFGSPLEKARFHSSRSEVTILKARIFQFNGDFQREWENRCEDLDRQKAMMSKLKKAVHDQKRRVTLEERRFEVGRTSALNVIQAQTDATQAEFLFHNTLIDQSRRAWSILELAGEIMTFAESSWKNSKALK